MRAFVALAGTLAALAATPVFSAEPVVDCLILGDHFAQNLGAHMACDIQAKKNRTPSQALSKPQGPVLTPLTVVGFASLDNSARGLSELRANLWGRVIWVATDNSAPVVQNVAEDHEDTVIVLPARFQRRDSAMPTPEGYRWLATQVEKERAYNVR